jgi:hypothetical protein
VESAQEISVSAIEQVCPPHHWLIESREVERQIVDFHRCVRCGQDKAMPRAASTGWPTRDAARPASNARAGRPLARRATPAA